MSLHQDFPQFHIIWSCVQTWSCELFNHFNSPTLLKVYFCFSSTILGVKNIHNKQEIISMKGIFTKDPPNFWTVVSVMRMKLAYPCSRPGKSLNYELKIT